MLAEYRLLTRVSYSGIVATVMSEAPDFRSEKMDSPEGRGIALGRWSAFWYSIPDDVLADACGDNPKRSITDYDAEVRDDIAEAVARRFRTDRILGGVAPGRGSPSWSPAVGTGPPSSARSESSAPGAALP